MKKEIDVDKKILRVSGLAATTVLATNIKEFNSKIPDLSSCVKKTDSDVKWLELEGKYTTKKSVNTSDISNLVKNSDLNAKLATLATKAELIA